MLEKYEFFVLTEHFEFRCFSGRRYKDYVIICSLFYSVHIVCLGSCRISSHCFMAKCHTG